MNPHHEHNGARAQLRPSASKSILFCVQLLLISSCYALYADNILQPGSPQLDRPTLTALGVQLPVTGDDNFNATVSVQYRVSGTQSWRTGLPLFRVHPETVAGYTVVPQFAGSILDLKPATTYDIQLHAVDPDGFDQIFSLTGTTRAIPADPIAPRVRNVTDSASLASALRSAVAGDVITLANGLYSGLFSISASGTATSPIVIRGVSEDGVVIDGGNCTGCNLFEVYGTGYVHIEKMTLQNAERAIRFLQSPSTGNVVRRVHIKNTTLGIGGRAGQLDFYIADNILEGRLVWPQIYSNDNGIHANDDGIAVSGFGHVVAHNRISGYGDAMKTTEDGARAIDFYGNDIGYTYDNGVELDGSEGNTRCLRNRFMNSYATISVQPILGGPSYVLRNIVVNVANEQLKFHTLAVTPPQEPSGVLVYHNTFVSPPNRELNLQAVATSHYFEIENNLFIAPSASGPEAADWTGAMDHGTFDYNGYFPNGVFRFNNLALGGYFNAPDFAGLQSLCMEPHGLIVSGALLANLTAPTTYTTLMPPADASLTAGSLALDRGRVLPNVNDGFTGSGPDLGALELGCPMPTYGPRLEGTDETNEIIDCSSAPVVIPASVVVSPSQVTVAASTTQQFTSVASPAATAVTWSITPNRGSITQSGLYTAPGDAKSGEAVTVTATPAISGTAGSASVTLTAATPPPSFTLAASAASAAAGGNGNSTVTVVPGNGFAAAVTLAASNWPAGITGTFGTNPTSGASNVSITVGSGVTAGAYSLAVSGTSGTLSSSTTIPLTVTAGVGGGTLPYGVNVTPATSVVTANVAQNWTFSWASPAGQPLLLYGYALIQDSANTSPNPVGGCYLRVIVNGAVQFADDSGAFSYGNTYDGYSWTGSPVNSHCQLLGPSSLPVQVSTNGTNMSVTSNLKFASAWSGKTLAVWLSGTNWNYRNGPWTQVGTIAVQ